MAIHYAKQLATAGRSKGIRIMVVTQRTQALHNALLGSCDTMIAHRLTAPADQEPVKKWLKANVSREIFDKVSTSLAGLKTGSAWICSGEAQVAELVQFPKISTFDDSATPTGNEASQEIKTAPVDQDKLRAIIGTAVKEAEVDDPKALRAENAQLKAELAKQPAVAPGADAAAIVQAEARGYRKGFEDAKQQGTTAFEGLKAMVRSTMQSFATSFDGNVRGETLEFAMVPQQSGSPSVLPRAPANVPMPPVKPTMGARPLTADGDGKLTGPEQRIINSLATWASWGQHQPSNS
jgi:helicase HerA-like protein